MKKMKFTEEDMIELIEWCGGEKGFNLIDDGETSKSLLNKFFQSKKRFKQGDIVVITYDWDNKNKPNKALYDFGYYNQTGGCVVYIKGCRNMQDSYAFKLNQLKLATKKDKKELSYGK